MNVIFVRGVENRRVQIGAGEIRSLRKSRRNGGHRYIYGRSVHNEKNVTDVLTSQLQPSYIAADDGFLS